MNKKYTLSEKLILSEKFILLEDEIAKVGTEADSDGGTAIIEKAKEQIKKAAENICKGVGEYIDKDTDTATPEIKKLNLKTYNDFLSKKLPNGAGDFEKIQNHVKTIDSWLRKLSVNKKDKDIRLAKEFADPKTTTIAETATYNVTDINTAELDLQEVETAAKKYYNEVMSTTAGKHSWNDQYKIAVKNGKTTEFFSKFFNYLETAAENKNKISAEKLEMLGQAFKIELSTYGFDFTNPFVKFVLGIDLEGINTKKIIDTVTENKEAAFKYAVIHNFIAAGNYGVSAKDIIGEGNLESSSLIFSNDLYKYKNYEIADYLEYQYTVLERKNNDISEYKNLDYIFFKEGKKGADNLLYGKSERFDAPLRDLADVKQLIKKEGLATNKRRKVENEAEVAEIANRIKNQADSDDRRCIIYIISYLAPRLNTKNILTYIEQNYTKYSDITTNIKDALTDSARKIYGILDNYKIDQKFYETLLRQFDAANWRKPKETSEEEEK